MTKTRSSRCAGISAAVLIFTLLAGCASTGYHSTRDSSPENDWTLCSAKGGLALGIPAAALHAATGGVAFIAGALFSGVACAAADTGMAVVQFDFNSSTLSHEQKSFLSQLAKDLKPGMVVEVTGHTCDLGSMAYNQALSEQRARAVKNYLVKKGVSGKYIHTVGKGESVPRMANNDDDHRAQNRRAEIRVINDK